MKNINLGYWNVNKSLNDVIKDFAFTNGFDTYVNKWAMTGISINGVHLIANNIKLVNCDVIVDFKIDNDVFLETK